MENLNFHYFVTIFSTYMPYLKAFGPELLERLITKPFSKISFGHFVYGIVYAALARSFGEFIHYDLKMAGTFFALIRTAEAISIWISLMA